MNLRKEEAREMDGHASSITVLPLHTRRWFWMILACVLPSVVLAEPNEIHAGIEAVYQEVLGRPADPEGLETYTTYLLEEGKDLEWLKSVLSSSQEAQSLRAARKARSLFLISTSLIAIGCTGFVVQRRKHILSSLIDLKTRCTPEHLSYLKAPMVLPPVAVLLAFLVFYSYFTADSAKGWILFGLILILVLMAAEAPRWVCTGILFCGLIALVAWGVFVDGTGDHDMASDRDDALEVAAAAVLQGENPWNHRSILGLPITTGPTSILGALPFVFVWNSINPLTFLAWLIFLLVLAGTDLWHRNQTFMTVSLFLMLPLSGFLHTLHWGLDELYYAAIFSPLLWWALAKGHLLTAGALGGLISLSRLSYAPAVLAVGLWWMFQERRSFRQLSRLTIGGGGCLFGILALFWAIGGEDFLQHNFWINSQMTALDDRSNVVSAVGTFLLGAFPDQSVWSVTLLLLILTPACYLLRHQPHPFYPMALAGVLAHTIAFSPAYPNDYKLTFLIPVMYGLCFTPLKRTGTPLQTPLSGQG